MCIENVKIIRDGELFIPKELWTALNDNFTKDEIKQYISDTIENENLELPYRNILHDEAIDDFFSLIDFDTSKLVKFDKFFSRYEYKYPFNDIYIDGSNVGNKSSDYFHQENRFKCDSINAPSPFRSWTIERFRLTLLNALWTLKFDHINNTKMRSAIGLRKYIASQFKPSVAKCMYDLFNARNVLDLSAGWGDRLAGACASSSVLSYTGVDPSVVAQECYNLQIDEYRSDTDITLISKPSEDIDKYDRMFDFIFTSPPYFIMERYSKDDTQSWQRYKKLDKWLNEYLFKTLEVAWNHLEVGGRLALNISDVYCNHTVNKICDPMNNFIDTLPNSEYVGAIGMRMAKRPNSKSAKDGIFAEPIWIWKKLNKETK